MIIDTYGCGTSKSTSAVAYTSTKAQMDSLLTWKSSLSHFNGSGALGSWNNTTPNNILRPLCAWKGIVCDRGRTVERLELQNQGLEGDLKNFNFSSFPNLIALNLQNNRLHGSILSHIGNLSRLELLDLSSNFLVGSIPREVGRLKSLTSLDVSNNEFIIGPIPSTIGKLERLIIIVSSIIFIALVLLVVLMISRSRRKLRKSTTNEGISTKSRNTFSIWNYDGQIAYEDIIQATEDFDIKYCIGVGGYGSVYKALLPKDEVVALEKFHRWERENLAFERSFLNEIQVLTKVRHRNIVKLYGFCCHTQCAFLMYEYLEKGSLFVALAEDVEASEFSWSKRYNVIEGISCASSYLHHDCNPPIIHRHIEQ